MSAITCPVCQGAFREVLREGILIDVCTQCKGVWLDRGELEKLLGLAQGHAPMPSSAPPQYQAPPQQHHQPQYQQPQYQRPYKYDDDDDDRRKYGEHYKKKKKGFDLGDIFDF
ncbi:MULTISPECIES: zf-TFIIB domain-containing protein [Asticcacaulis]|uniref:TFIIB-type zinc ribbon-containing protein n=1 Tax=Asticcacaulis TaxID=76890 RepID=UPI001AE74800|nr:MULTISPECIES: zf-TFIIB domain-containing protein [Asticcacaulis]MBP2158691.1 Zn-finger nucleic acid-binding protein [Asticcacaulis solisilvae]MDR6799737.1 Zn-finger nucleic acid-binding protein [Asticcacaulis sp. BE141]